MAGIFLDFDTKMEQWSRYKTISSMTKILWLMELKTTFMQLLLIKGIAMVAIILHT